MNTLYWINPATPDQDFPDVEQALREPDGLLAAGGDLSPQRVLSAYRRGIFPWYSEGQPILWWSPDPRAVLFPTDLKLSRSLRRTLRRCRFDITWDSAFEQVIDACAAPRAGAGGTWITPEMATAYTRLHRLGYAHSVEARVDGKLVGGLYGIALGRVFFGESMFSRMPDASKVAFAHLVRQLHHWGFELIDCQVYSDHLASLGARTVPRAEFTALLDECVERDHRPGPWRPPLLSASEW